MLGAEFLRLAMPREFLAPTDFSSMGFLNILSLDSVERFTVMAYIYNIIYIIAQMIFSCFAPCFRRPGYCIPAALGAALAGRCRGEEVVSVATVGDGSLEARTRFDCLFFARLSLSLCLCPSPSPCARSL